MFHCPIINPAKKQTVSSTTSTSDRDVHQLKSIRKFLPRWKYLFPWVEIEHEGTKTESLYCHECRAAGLKNDVACGKSCPPKGWKKEYLRRHTDSSDHTKHDSLAISTA